jgi:uncharacterized protein (DUF1330 family)
MSVYAIIQLKIHDRSAYDRYVSQFMPVFAKYEGTVLAADDRPDVLEGEWPMNRVVLLSFPTKSTFHDWSRSPEYRAIAKDRIAGADAIILLAEGLQ